MGCASFAGDPFHVLHESRGDAQSPGLWFHEQVGQFRIRRRVQGVCHPQAREACDPIPDLRDNDGLMGRRLAQAPGDRRLRDPTAEVGTIERFEQRDETGSVFRANDADPDSRRTRLRRDRLRPPASQNGGP